MEKDSAPKGDRKPDDWLGRLSNFQVSDLGHRVSGPGFQVQVQLQVLGLIPAPVPVPAPAAETWDLKISRPTTNRLPLIPASGRAAITMAAVRA